MAITKALGQWAPTRAWAKSLVTTNFDPDLFLENHMPAYDAARLAHRLPAACRIKSWHQRKAFQRKLEKAGKSRTLVYDERVEDGCSLLLPAESFPMGLYGDGRLLFQHPDLLTFASVPGVEVSLLFVRRSLADATLSTIRRFSNKGKGRNVAGKVVRGGESVATGSQGQPSQDLDGLSEAMRMSDASATLVQSQYNALCRGHERAAEARAFRGLDPGALRCTAVAFEDVCSNDTATRHESLAAIADALGVPNARGLDWGTFGGGCQSKLKAANYDPAVKAHVARFAGQRSMLYPQAANAAA